MTKKKIGIILGVGIIFVAVLFVAQRLFFAAPQVQEKNEVFTVGLKQDEAQILDKLKSQGFIRNKPAFNFVLSINRKHDAIQPGGYNISKNMDAWQLAEKLTDNPDMKWVVIPEGWRKEQIGEKLADTFGWSNEEIDKWNTEYTKMRIDYIEGTYFPD
ncbi:MAG TPA: endolytic transglycosylase MltG, partial [Candidatus Moranbacteria bacterium]|nr:endolytic transglycosylase MltG [Candidatus Moranbacteria bacterium]